MTSIPKYFLATGALFALVGMAWGIQMSATHDHTLSPAHGHLNLIGFVTMSLFGIYYALTPEACTSRLCLVHYAVSLAAVLLLIPGIVMALTGQGETLAKIGSLAALLSMGIFAVTVFLKGVGARG